MFDLCCYKTTARSALREAGPYVIVHCVGPGNLRSMPSLEGYYHEVRADVLNAAGPGSQFLVWTEGPDMQYYRRVSREEW